MRLNLKQVLIIAYLLCDHGTVLARITALGPSFSLALFIGLYALTAASLFLTASIRNTPTRLTFAAIFAMGSIVLQSYEWGTRQKLTYSAFLMLIDSRGDIGDALYQYGPTLQTVVPLGLLLFVALALPPRQDRLPGWLTASAPITTVALLTAILFYRGGEGAQALPAPFAPAAYAIIQGGVALTTKTGRDPVTLPRTSRTDDRDIILIVDESISAQYFDINHPDGVRTGLGDKPRGISITNYGYAAAILNCSAGSNATLRFGGTRENYRRMATAGPTIWSYARQAGMKTAYLDAQRNHGELQNLMTPQELTEIDDFVQMDDVPILERDVTLAAMIAQYTRNGRADFVYVNKVGGHFPVHDRFPDSMMQYRPTLHRGQYVHASDTGQKKGFAGTPEDWRRYRNSYRNTLLWNVGEFFDRLFAKADFSRATMIYTADHGQDLHERNTPGSGTHCGTNPAQEEGLVPLVVLEGDGAATLDWKRHIATNRNAMSHYRIFPTLLALMGYRQDSFREEYGEPLTSPAKDPFTFNIDYYTLLGRQPTWRKIELSRIPAPPTSDYKSN